MCSTSRSAILYLVVLLLWTPTCVTHHEARAALRQPVGRSAGRAKQRVQRADTRARRRLPARARCLCYAAACAPAPDSLGRMVGRVGQQADATLDTRFFQAAPRALLVTWTVLCLLPSNRLRPFRCTLPACRYVLRQGLTELRECKPQTTLRPGRPQVEQQRVRWAGLRAAQCRRQAGSCASDVGAIAAQRQDHVQQRCTGRKGVRAKEKRGLCWGTSVERRQLQTLARRPCPPLLGIA